MFIHLEKVVCVCVFTHDEDASIVCLPKLFLSHESNFIGREVIEDDMCQK